MSDQLAQMFLLDDDANPHPRMLAGALEARDDARTMGFDPWDPATSYWRGYLKAMADATGLEPADIESWMDGHETGWQGGER